MTDSTAVDAAKRLGCLDEAIAATTLPDYALEGRHVLIVDGRQFHGNNLVLWLAELTPVPRGRCRVVAKLYTLPRRTPYRPEVYTEANKRRIEIRVLTRDTVVGTVTAP